jgi:hypothetical protein
MSNSLPEIMAFVEAWNPDPFKVIVKPLNSAGSDSVILTYIHSYSYPNYAIPLLLFHCIYIYVIYMYR